LVQNDASNQAITNDWHQALSPGKREPLIQTVLHNYGNGNKTINQHRDGKVNFIQRNKELIQQKYSHHQAKNTVTYRPRSFVLEEDRNEPTNDSSKRTQLEHQYEKRQSIPRQVNSRTVFSPNETRTSAAYDRIMTMKTRPQSAQSIIKYQTTRRHNDVVTNTDETLRPRSALALTHPRSEFHKRPTYEEPFKKKTPKAGLNIQGFSINKSKVVHEGHYQPPKTAQRGAPRPQAPPHTVALCVHNSRFGIEN